MSAARVAKLGNLSQIARSRSLTANPGCPRIDRDHRSAALARVIAVSDQQLQAQVIAFGRPRSG